MRRVPLIVPDLPSLDEVAEPIRQALELGRVTNFGPRVQAFEGQIESFLGARVVALSSGTLGLMLTLKALGLKPGQSVILPSFTFVATAQAVAQAGGTPVFAEVGEDLTLCVDDLQALLQRNPDVGAVVPVHTFGMPCAVSAIDSSVADYSRRVGREVPIVYDAAHAFGASVAGRAVGTFGAAEVFSLSVTKVLVSVEGGLVSTRDATTIESLRAMRNYGIADDYDAALAGLNGKMSELHAIIGSHNLGTLPDRLEARQASAHYYRHRIDKETGFRNLPWPEDVVHPFKDFTVLTPEGLSERRSSIVDHLRAGGVETRTYFDPPVHHQGFFRRFADRPLTRTERVSSEVITLPFFSTITESDMDHVVGLLAEAEARLR